MTKDFPTDYRTVAVRTVDGQTLHGKINIAGNERVSELFTVKTEPFVVMIDVKNMDMSLDSAPHKKLFINKNHIVWVEPYE